MPAYPPHVWDQVRNTTCKELIRALERDGFERDEVGTGAVLIYRHPLDGRRIDVHWKPGKTYGPKLLKSLLDDAGWTTPEALRRVGLIG